MIENIEAGTRLQGSIFKDELSLYEDRVFITSINKEREAFGENVLQVDLFDNDEPKVLENDICRLVLNDGQELDIQVIKVAEVAPQFMLIFSLEPLNPNQEFI
jgi:hypothetical protein